MKETLAEINALREAGVIGQWAIGGAVGATFYLEPFTTLDIDVFVVFENAPLVLTLTPVFDFLRARGHCEDREGITVHGWSVQFIAAESGLLREAVESAIDAEVEGVAARVMKIEHLMAIALETGRPKDKARLIAFVESGLANEARLGEILCRYNLQERWDTFRQSFLKKS
jgi:hypothetical protein